MDNNLNLSELEKELDEVLSKETSETLSNWLLTKRKTNNMDFKNLIKQEGAGKILSIFFNNLQDLIVEKLKQHNNKFYFKTNQNCDIDYSETEDFSFLTAVNEWDLPHLHNNYTERIVVEGIELVKEEENEYVSYLTKCLNTGKNDRTNLCFETETLANIYDLICRQEYNKK